MSNTDNYTAGDSEHCMNEAPQAAPPAGNEAPPVPNYHLADSDVTPRWIKDIFRFLPVKSHFILSNNIRDRYPFPAQPERCMPLDLVQYLTEALRTQGFDYFIKYNQIEGFSAVVPRGDSMERVRAFFSKTFEIKFDACGQYRCSKERSLEIFEQIVKHQEHFIAIYADFASRYTVKADSLTEDEHLYFTKAYMLSQSVLPHITKKVSSAMFNSVFWLCDRENDLPAWFIAENSRIRGVIIPKPDHIQRRALIKVLAPSLKGFKECNENGVEQFTEEFVDQTEGMVLGDVVAITQLCRKEELGFEEISEAVRRYKIGVPDDPWKKLSREKVLNGEEFIRKRVKGQDASVVKALDIIKRAMMGLSGAQTSRLAGGKPRGLMFLAGPTGVGKTELAKALTELLFGDERAYIRFDMSEFSAQHADQRLMGAPPGYVGFEAGGELTNAIKEKPFSVVLFDEIEKAHPRILDKLLQIIDEGALTSGKGERVYFSESVLVFTSNLGIYKDNADGQRVLNVSMNEPYADVAKKVRLEIDKYFKTDLNRPEILNRIGENIVVFDFIRQDIAVQIFDKMLENIKGRMLQSKGITIELPDEIKTQLLEFCIKDLSNGGRGIGNQLEAWLINPLGRALFDFGVQDGHTVRITEFKESEGVPELKIEVV